MTLDESEPVKQFAMRLPILPKGQGRPRFDPRSGRAYTPPTTRAYADVIKSAALLQWGDEPALEGPVTISVVAQFAIPKTAKGRKHHVQKPDASNILKAVEDALNGIVFKDDSQIVSARVRKEWALEHSLHITVWSVE